MVNEYSPQGFEGTTGHTCDPKGRLIVPSKFRDVVKTSGKELLILTFGLGDTLYAFTWNSWEKKKRQLGSLTIPNSREIKRFFLGSAVTCAFDKQGRVMIPKLLRDHAAIEKDVMLVGIDDYFEIWSEDKWSAKHGESRDIVNSDLAIAGLEQSGIF